MANIRHVAETDMNVRRNCVYPVEFARTVGVNGKVNSADLRGREAREAQRQDPWDFDNRSEIVNLQRPGRT
jgi:hypothetical protein